MLTLAADISEQVGLLSALRDAALTPQLRQAKRIRSIEALTESAQSDQVDDQVDDQVARLLVLLKQSPALAAGLIEMTDPASPRSPVQKYRLTQRGQAVAARA
ncbi:Fic family protein [Pseudomonas sp. TMP25]|uniref:Fic family protein n=1 Tax=Pseudomonas sp. TMP25 TaxID=3136561 RepID=UPI0031017FEB